MKFKGRKILVIGALALVLTTPIVAKAGNIAK